MSSVIGKTVAAVLCRNGLRRPGLLGNETQIRGLVGVAAIQRNRGAATTRHWSPCGNQRPGASIAQVARFMSDDSSSGGFQKVLGQNEGEQKNATEGADTAPPAHEKMGIVFTCTNCDARVQRFFSKRSYQRGVVIVRVEKEDGCNRKDGGETCLHLIADNLGWFEDQPTNVETLMAQRGEAVHRMVVRESVSDNGGENGESGEGGKVKERVLVKADDGKTVELFEESPDQDGDPLLLK